MNARSGLTLIELAIVLALTAIFVVNLATLSRTAEQLNDESAQLLEVERQARLTLDRIAFALVGADHETLFPLQGLPLFTDSVRYAVSLGVEDGRVVWAGEETIALDEAGERVEWHQAATRNEPERRAVWCALARPFLLGERPNDQDDNDNTLVDERGLTFVLQGRRIVVHLTLGPRSGEGQQRVFTTEVTCRN